MKATEVTAGLAESNGSLLPGLWRDSLHVTCGLTACTTGSAPGPTLGNEYGKTLPFFTQITLQHSVGQVEGSLSATTSSIRPVASTQYRLVTDGQTRQHIPR